MLKRSAVLNAVAGIGAELLFALLPLIVITLVLSFKEKSVFEVLASPEWSFGSAILYGQTLMKFVSGLARSPKPSWQRVSLAVAALFVLTIVPTLVILAMIIISAEHPQRWLVICQVVMFVLSMIVFFVFGTIGHLWVEKSGDGSP